MVHHRHVVGLTWAQLRRRSSPSNVPGDYGGSCRRFAPFISSPPRAWGLCLPALEPPSVHRFTPTCVGTMHVAEPHLVERCRFTPTCVGTISSIATTNIMLAVHPHVRGDYFSARIATRNEIGSPPRAWGLFQRQNRHQERDRFTPTCVGTM